VTPVDGRRARRERNRQKVIDAVFLLIQDGKVPPTVEDVARRAGVSVSSVFRNFDGLGDLQRHAFDRFHDRFAVLLDAAPPAGADRPARIRHHVDTRIELCSRAGQLMQLARHRALDHQPIADGVARLRSRLADQAGRHFADEASRLAPADAAALLALIDAATSPEVFELMRAAHACSSRQIARTWTTALAVLLDGWPTLASTGAPTASEEHP
jgi:AcrR family transcriptional regulator